MQRNLKLLVVLCAVVCCGCQASPGQSTPSSDTITPSSTAVVSPLQPTPSQNDALQYTLKQLLDQNLNLVMNVFVYGTLGISSDNPVADDGTYTPINSSGGNWFLARTDQFASYEALKEYVQDTYMSDTSDSLLNNWPNGEPLYKDIGGKLCVNLDWTPNTSPTTDWTGYTFTFVQNDIDSVFIDVTVTALLSDESAEFPYQNLSAPYHIYGSATLDGSQWRLDRVMVDNFISVT